MEDFRDHVKKGFSACKSDIDSLKLNNDDLILKLKNLEEENSKLKNDMSDMNNSMIEMKAELKGINIALTYINEFNEKKSSSVVQPIKEIPIVQESQVSHIEIPIQRQQVKQDPYEALLAFKAKSNKRDVLKQKMLSMITDSGMNLSELKFMFVEHFRYCSKATFYNYLKELEIEKLVKIERENSKNYIYLNSVKVQF